MEQKSSFIFIRALLSESINENFNILKENKYLKAEKGLNISLEKYLKDILYVFLSHKKNILCLNIALDIFIKDFKRLFKQKDKYLMA